MIRTKYFLDLIEWLANLAPRFWRLFADAAVVFSFGGLGASYVSRFGRDRGNMSIIISFLGICLAYVYRIDFQLVAAALLGSFILGQLCRREGTALISGLSVTAIILLIGTGVGIPFSPSLFASSFLGVPAFLLITLSEHGYQIVTKQTNIPGISPALPATTEDGELVITFPGTGINLPIIYFLIVIAVTMVAHELSHGILARVYGLKVKSTGILTAGIMPIGAFVEPDEDELNKRPSIEKMHLFSVGSFANILVALVSILILKFLLVPIAGAITYVDGMEVIGFDTSAPYPAEEQLNIGDVVYEINGQVVSSTDLFFSAARRLEIDGPVNMVTDKGSISFNATVHPENESRAYMGVVMQEHSDFIAPYKDMELLKLALGFIAVTLTWMFFINLSISLVNLLPIVPFDGGKMLLELLKLFDVGQVTTNRIVSGIIAYIILLIFVNVSPLLKDLADLVTGLLG
ncbi:MAG: site-2 protease family protein [Candidatus Altiarchaeota archaeon]